jgi:hypothetical protein
MEALAVPFAGDLEMFISEDLYPYRWPLTIGLVVLFVAACAFAYWMC